MAQYNIARKYGFISPKRIKAQIIAGNEEGGLLPSRIVEVRRIRDQLQPQRSRRLSVLENSDFK